MRDQLTIFVVYVFIYTIIEFIYFSITSRIYRAHFAKIQKMRVGDVDLKMIPYGIFAYLTLFVVVWYFVIREIFRNKTIKITELLVRSTLLALAIYGIYNLTNAATLKDYSMTVVFQDTLWGILALNFVTLSCYLVYNWKSKV